MTTTTTTDAVLARTPEHPWSRRGCHLLTAVALTFATAALTPAATATTPGASSGYGQFCVNNSDLCTVTELVPSDSTTSTHIETCMLDTSPNQCPARGIIIDGPYHEHPSGKRPGHSS